MSDVEILDAAPPWMVTIEQAAEIMGVSTGGARDVLNSRDIKPCAKLRQVPLRNLYRRAEVQRAADERALEYVVPDGYCRANEASRITGLGEAALASYARQGRVDAVKVPRGRGQYIWVFRREALESGGITAFRDAMEQRLGAVREFCSHVPSGYVLASDFQAKYGFADSFFFDRLKKLAGVAVGTNEGRAYPRELMEREFADVLPPGGYVDGAEARKILGYKCNQSGGLPRSVSSIQANAIAYKTRKNWYRVADLLAVVERRSTARREAAIRAHAERQTRCTVQAAAAVFTVPAETNPTEHDLTTLEGIRARRAELCARYRVEMED